MGLAFRQFQADGQAFGIDQRVDLRRQAAPRATPCNRIGRLFWCSGGVLVHADAGAVDHLDVAVVQPFETASRSRFQTPALRHRLKRLTKFVGGP